MQKPIASGILRQIFIILLIMTSAAAILWELIPYMSGILGAITIYVLFRKWMKKLIVKGWNSSLAAILLMVLSFVGILLPITGILLMLGNRITKTMKSPGTLIDSLKEQLSVWEDTLGYDLTSQLDFNSISGWLTENLKSAAGGTFTMFISLAIMYFLIFYMLTIKGNLGNTLSRFVPLGRDSIKEISEEIVSSVRSNAIGIPLVAVAQGIIALIGFLIFGVEKPFFWFVIVTVGSMVPFIGTFIGILPVFILSLAAGQNFQAWGILIYGVVVVGSTDNIIRLYVLKKLDDVHPLITLLGVIVGVPLFGFIGLIFGPLLISLFLTVVKIYSREFGTS